MEPAHTQSILTPCVRNAGTRFMSGSTQFSPVGWSRKSGCKKKLHHNPTIKISVLEQPLADNAAR